MQLWHGRVGEIIQLGRTGIRGNFVVAVAADGVAELLVPEPDRDETIQDAIDQAKLREKARRAHCRRKAGRRRGLTDSGESG